MVTIREITQADIPLLLDYWFTAEHEFLAGMGVDVTRLPDRADFGKMLEGQILTPYPEKRAYALIWLLEGQPVGHSNLNPIVFGEHAWMHLHMWKAANREKGLGEQFIRLCLPEYFSHFNLREIYCEPYALNPAPHKVVEKVGFTFEKEYTTVPGSINFEQPVKRWVLTRAHFDQLSENK